MLRLGAQVTSCVRLRSPRYATLQGKNFCAQRSARVIHSGVYRDQRVLAFQNSKLYSTSSQSSKPDPDKGPVILSGKKASLVIFDKDGTLVTYGSGWTEAVIEKTKKIEKDTNKPSLSLKMLDLWGYDVKRGIWVDGLYCDSHDLIVEGTLKLLVEEGVDEEDGRLIVKDLPDHRHFGISDESLRSVEGIDNPSDIITRLKRYGVKVGISTADNRRWTDLMLEGLNIAHLVDCVICGNDPGSQPKPHPQNILDICSTLQVSPQETIMVGDTWRDIEMGKNAGVMTTVGVRCGVGTTEQLSEADVILPRTKDVLDLALPSGHHTFSASPTGLGQPQRSFSSWPLAGSSAMKRNPFKNSVADRCYSTASGHEEYDYVIVGAGSAGCVLANKLSAKPDNKVLLLEAGGKDMSWKFHMPAALMYTLMDPKFNWCYYTTPQKNVNNREMYWPRGKVWGGSSSHNAMVYIRGNPLDYDRWQEEGATGWSYADCLPYFRKAQTHELGENEYRGGDGPLSVSRGTAHNVLHEAFIEAGLQAGYPHTEDCNGYQQEGFGPFEMTIQKGKRSSTSVAYLRPVLKRANLSMVSRALTTRVLFEGNKAVGVEFQTKLGTKQVRARKEVILSGGAINSPQILMLSGVGNADHLAEHDIPVVAHVPGVGENLQDHLEIHVQHECTQPVSLYKYQWKYPLTMIKAGVEWFLRQTGDAATTHMESGAFIRTRPGVEYADIQYHFLPSAMANHGQEMRDQHAFQAHVSPMRPTSIGNIRLKSKSPSDYPLMDPNYLATEKDKQDFRDCVRLTREVFSQKAFDKYRGPEMQPGPNCQSDSEIDAFVRAKSDTAYHPSCTNKMGQSSDRLAVVDPQCRVFGVESLRVVDASVMPSIVSGNLNGPTIMIAEKAADIILGNQPLPRSTAPVWRPQSLETQRGM